MKNLIKCLKNFTVADAIDWHEQLIIEIPSGFFRYSRIEKYSDIEWTPMKVKFVWNYKILRFTILLNEHGTNNLPELKMTKFGGIGKREEWIFASPVIMSLPQARKLVMFLQDHFGGHDFSLRNKLS